MSELEKVQTAIGQDAEYRALRRSYFAARTALRRNRIAEEMAACVERISQRIAAERSN